LVQFKKEKVEKVSFRDQLATIDAKGNRKWVYAKKPKGKFTTARNIVGIVLLVIFFTGPFMRLGGQQVLLLNFIDRVFIIFGVQFWPQDFHLFFLAMISFMVFIILFTVTYGRLWCGWACPQTIFMEIIFRRIEFWIEGNAYKQKQLENQSWNSKKIFKRGLKHSIFFLISFIISNFFLMYIIGSEAWFEMVTGDPAKHLAGLVWMIIFSGVFYFVFSWFREQVCTIVCPYGRLQGVLLDRKSIAISYDYKRGNPKGTFHKGEDRQKAGLGDCINCTQCVQVCPTGIDIRNGTQLECISCACCIDACNSQMKAVGFKPGLIRYASDKTIAEGEKFRFNIRTAAYSFVLIVLLGATIWSLAARTDIEATVLRAPGMLYQDQGNGVYSNLYNIKLVNKTSENLPVRLELLSHKGKIQVIGQEINVAQQTIGESVFFIFLEEDQIRTQKTAVEIGVYSGNKLIDVAKATFVGPNVN